MKRTVSVTLLMFSLAAGADQRLSTPAPQESGTNAASSRQALVADLALREGGAGTGILEFKRADKGAVARSLHDKLGDALHAKDFGVKCDGAADDTPAINAALAAAAGKTLYFPAGNCNYRGGGSLAAGTVIVGAGRHATKIRALSAATTLFTAAGYGSGLRSLAFHAGLPQTGGAYVWLSGPESFIEDFYMTGDFNGILMTGNVARIRHGRFQNGAPGAIRIRAEGGDNSQLIDDVLMGAQSPQVAAAGIRVRNSSALIISNTSVIQQGIGLLVDPYTGATGSGATDAGGVFSLYVHHCFFDNSSPNGIRINPTGNAPVVRSRFDNVWASSSSADGVLINNAGTGTVSGLHFESVHAILNAGSGFSLHGPISDISINGGEIAQNSFGIYQNAGVNGFRVRGAVIGAGAGVKGNANAAIVLAAASEGILIAENDLRGNGSTIIDKATSAAHKTITGNIGHNPQANTGISVTGSPFAWTNTTGETVLLFVNGGVVSKVSVAGKTVAAATNTMVIVPRGTTAVVTYSSVPALSYNGL